MRRSTTAAIATCGTLIGHAIAYSLPHEDALGSEAAHAYLHLAYVVAIPAALIAALTLIRRDGRGRPNLGELVIWQLVLFLFQESVERGVLGLSPISLIREPVLWWGLTAEVVIAVVASASIDFSVEVIRRRRGLRGPELDIGPATIMFVPALAPFSGTPHLAAKPRAPPLTLHV
ncbi:MAG TPA: hypothetical protein VE569_09680 [Acidimicrobiia bacterium]|nr:hypothetical protein [Acidimicrobiia bacterium]